MNYRFLKAPLAIAGYIVALGETILSTQSHWMINAPIIARLIICTLFIFNGGWFVLASYAGQKPYEEKGVSIAITIVGILNAVFYIAGLFYKP